MDYEIVTLSEKKFVGITARTSNSDPNMQKIIGGLYTKFFQDGIYQSILNKSTGNVVGLYSDYESDQNGEYNITVCCEVTDTSDAKENTVIKLIPSGKYAKFIVTGNLHTEINTFWQKLWSMDLNRKFTGDFEDYVNNDVNNCEIHVYIRLND